MERSVANGVIQTLGNVIQKTPLLTFDADSSPLGLNFGLYIKDESSRLGQRSFKALGGSYAGARAVGRHLGLDENATFEAVRTAAHSASLTLATASDGNHGAGVAWAAKELGQHAVVWLPKGAHKSRLDAIRSLGGDARSSELPYDETVALAAATATQQGWIFVQDTAWEGYTQVPRDIMDAYHVIALEALRTMPVLPTHVIVQVGVGSFAAAITEHVFEYFDDRDARRPAVISVEPRGSACMFASLRGGKKVSVVDSPPTICVGLDCGTVSELSWPVLQHGLSAAATLSDEVAADGLRSLRTAGCVSGESGAATAVGLLRALGDERRRELLGIDAESHVLCFNTEGTTAPDITEKILCGAYLTANQAADTLGRDVEVHVVANNSARL